MNIYSYVVRRDYGFAPNPFYGYCTLATCMPVIRRHAQVGDWIIGTGSKTKHRETNLVYYMVISEILSFTDYWNDMRFLIKRPDLKGSKKRAYGDNIYHFEPDGGAWRQLNSHHSKEDGSSNIENIRNDTQSDRVLVSEQFAYWGGKGPAIPATLRSIIKSGRGYKKYHPENLVASTVQWARSLPNQGFCGRPIDWPSTS